LATAAYPGASPAAPLTSIAAPALLDAGSTPAPGASDSATSALSTASAYSSDPPPLRNADSSAGASQTVSDTSPANDRSGGYAVATTMESELPAETAEMSPRYGDSVAPILSPQEVSPVKDDIGPIGESPLQGVIRSVRTKIDAGEWYEALFKLSLYYGREDLSDADRKELLDLLDPLAGKVIYSNEHLIEAAYQVQGNETLEEIAQRHNVPWQLLANINAIQNPQAIAPGTQLKVVRGPFHVDISTSRNELTLYAGKLYAGRFKVALGNNPAAQPGEYRVADKLPGRTYYANGQTIAVGDPANPYGAIWIDLGNNVGIHGSGSVGPSADGCIGLSATDANDLYGILSRGSSVVIRR
jgi:lipoprotein-anchoring transpeptidase ErfK/SrfK